MRGFYDELRRPLSASRICIWRDCIKICIGHSSGTFARDSRRAPAGQSCWWRAKVGFAVVVVVVIPTIKPSFGLQRFKLSRRSHQRLCGGSQMMTSRQSGGLQRGTIESSTGCCSSPRPVALKCAQIASPAWDAHFPTGAAPGQPVRRRTDVAPHGRVAGADTAAHQANRLATVSRAFLLSCNLIHTPKRVRYWPTTAS